jgi:hypothetical protein
MPVNARRRSKVEIKQSVKLSATPGRGQPLFTKILRQRAKVAALSHLSKNVSMTFFDNLI